MFLLIASILLLVVIAVLNYVYQPLRQDTISDGLYSVVPDHWMLDAAYVVMAAALAVSFTGLSQVLALISGAGLLIGGVSNTCSVWVDKVTKGNHNKIHSIASVIMFLAALALEVTKNQGWLWYLTGAGVVLPALMFFGFKKFKSLGINAFPAAEKCAVTLLCSWMAVWSLIQ